MISVVIEMPHMYIYFTGFVNISIVTRQEKNQILPANTRKTKIKPKIYFNKFPYLWNEYYNSYFKKCYLLKKEQDILGPFQIQTSGTESSEKLLNLCIIC